MLMLIRKKQKQNRENPCMATDMRKQFPNKVEQSCSLVVLALDIRATSFTEMQNDSMFIRTSRFGGSLVGAWFPIFMVYKR